MVIATLMTLEELQQRITRLRKALNAATDVGIYPQSVVGGDNPYEKRTEWMEGWNASQMESLKAASKELKRGDWDDDVDYPDTTE